MTDRQTSPGKRAGRQWKNLKQIEKWKYQEGRLKGKSFGQIVLGLKGFIFPSGAISFKDQV